MDVAVIVNEAAGPDCAIDQKVMKQGKELLMLS